MEKAMMGFTALSAYCKNMGAHELATHFQKQLVFTPSRKPCGFLYVV
jgi:hypothetical protein